MLATRHLIFVFSFQHTQCLSVLAMPSFMSVFQMVNLKNWSTNAVPVRELQRVTVNSSCVGWSLCGSTFYSLVYGAHKTCENTSALHLSPATVTCPSVCLAPVSLAPVCLAPVSLAPVCLAPVLLKKSRLYVHSFRVVCLSDNLCVCFCQGRSL